MISFECERIGYRVTSLSDIRRVVRVKAERRKRWLTREVVLETSQDVIKRGKRGRRTRGGKPLDHRGNWKYFDGRSDVAAK